MKKKKIILGFITIAGAGLCALGKTKTQKSLGAVALLSAGGALLYDSFKEERKKVEKDCQETEEIIEKSGLDIEKVSEIDLLATEEDEEPQFGRILLRESYKSNVFSDEMLEYDPKDYFGTLHILQNVEKNRIIISIPMPRRNKKGLCPTDIREHFTKIYEDFIEDNSLDMQVFLNQVCVHIGIDEKDSYTYFSEIEREDGETFNEYLHRITNIIDAWENGDKPFHKKFENYNDTKTIKFIQYLNLEFPVFPATSRKKGLNLITTMSLLRELTGQMSILVGNTQREQIFEFSHIAFHPTDDYGTIFVEKDGEIITEDL